MLNFFSIYFNSLLLAFAVLSTLALLRGSSAALRHQILVGFFTALAILPIGTLLLPKLLGKTIALPLHRPSLHLETPASPVGSPEWMESWQRDHDERRRTTMIADRFGVKAGHIYEKAVAPNFFSRAGLVRFLNHLPSALLALWIAGTLAVLIVQLTRWAGAGFIAEMSNDFEVDGSDEGSLQTACDRIVRELGLRIHVRVLQSDMASVAMAWGFRRPCVVMPSDARNWTTEKRECVLRHEISHIKRRDNALQALVVLICAIHWPNPLVWIALRRLHLEREVACDDTVLQFGTLPSAYAKHLMEIAMKFNGPKSKSIVPALMAHSSNMKRRLMSVLDPKVDRKPLGRSRAAAVLVFVVLASAPLSVLRLWEGSGAITDARAERWSATRVEALKGRTDTRNDLYFNGSNTHIVIPDADEFDFQGSFSLEACVNVASLEQSGQDLYILTKHQSHVMDAGEWAWIIMGPPNPVGRIQFTVWAGDNGYTASSDPGAVQSSGEHCDGWQDLAFSYSSETSEWWIFVDGQVVGSGSGHLDIGQTERDLWIGWESSEPSHDFFGWMREIRISDTCRYNAPYNHETPLEVDFQTLAYYDFSEGSGSQLNDLSGNGHHGSINNGAWDLCLDDIDKIIVEPGTNLQSVVDAAPDGASIILLPGLHMGPVVFSGRHLSLCGSGVDQTTLDANFYDYAVLVKNEGSLHLCDLKIVNGFNDDPVEYYYPAALTVDDGFAEVEHCIFENNLNAVGAWRSNSQVGLTECSVLTGDAFGLMTREAESSTSISATNCTVTGERTTTDHGLVKMWGGILIVNQCIFTTPNGRAIEYHSGTWGGDCNIVHAAVQVGGGLALPPNHWNIDPLLCDLAAWSYQVLPASPALPGNNDCGVLIGSGASCWTSVIGTDWGTLKKLY